MKIRFYTTPNSWWYVLLSITRRHVSMYALGRCITVYWGPNAKYVP